MILSEDIQILKNRLASGSITIKQYNMISKKLVAEIKSGKTNTDPSHAAGLVEISEPSPGSYNIPTDYSKEVIKSWVPQYSMVPFSRGQNPKPLTAAILQQNKTKDRNYYPKYFMNAYQDIDYLVLEDIYKNTITGRIVDRLADFIWADGIVPVLKLRNPKKIGDEDAQQKLIEANQDIIDNLVSIDENISNPETDDDLLDYNFNVKGKSLLRNALIYGRCAGLKEYSKPVKVNGKSYSTIPDTLKIAYPRDMGMVEIDQPSWKLKSLQLRFMQKSFTPSNMIYLEHNPLSPVYNSMHYGFSIMQSMIGASRTLRQMIETDFPTISKHLWAGIGFLYVKPQGTTQSAKNTELSAITSNIKAGRINALMEDPANTRTDYMDLNPKIAEMVTLAEFLITYGIGQLGMPSALFTQEKDTNRATLLGKIRLFMAGPIKSYRDWVGGEYSRQHYMRNFQILYKDQSKILEQFRIETSFTPIKLEAWSDLVQGVQQLDEMAPLKAKAIGKLLDLPDYTNMIDPDKPKQEKNPLGKLSKQLQENLDNMTPTL